MARVELSIFPLVISVLLLFSATTSSGLTTDEAQLLLEIKQPSAPYREQLNAMMYRGPMVVTERMKTIKSELVKLEAEIAEQNLDEKYVEIMQGVTRESNHRTTEVFSKAWNIPPDTLEMTPQEAVCALCAASLGINLQACVECVFLSIE